jgi:hypothetical protein
MSARVLFMKIPEIRKGEIASEKLRRDSEGRAAGKSGIGRGLVRHI